MYLTNGTINITARLQTYTESWHDCLANVYPVNICNCIQNKDLCYKIIPLVLIIISLTILIPIISCIL